MKTFKQYLTEKKDHIINKIPSLSKKQKEEVINFFKTHTSYEKYIDWNNWKELTYDDFKVLINKAKISKTQAKKKGISGLDPEQYIKLDQTIFDLKKNEYNIYIPLSYHASKIIASKKVGGIEGKWCTAFQKNIFYWLEYTSKEEKIMVYLKPINESVSFAFGIEILKNKDVLFWNKNDEEIDNYQKYFRKSDVKILVKKVFEREEEIRRNYYYYLKKELYNELLKMKSEDIEIMLTILLDKEYFEKHIKIFAIFIKIYKKYNKNENIYFLIENNFNGLKVKNKNDMKELEDAIIDSDFTGKLCCDFAKKVKGANIKKLQEAVIEKDKTGEECFYFAENVKGVDIKELQKAVIEKDKKGKWCYFFASVIEGANIKELQKAVIEKDKSGHWCFQFAKNIKGADISKLENAIIEKDQIGEVCYYFIEDVKEADINNVIQKMKEKFGENNKYYKEALKLRKIRKNYENI